MGIRTNFCLSSYFVQNRFFLIIKFSDVNCSCLVELLQDRFDDERGDRRVQGENLCQPSIQFKFESNLNSCSLDARVDLLL